MLAAVEAEPRRPADAIANDYFRARRFIGASDRRAVAERAWGVIRQRLRLDWWLARAGAPAATPRLLVGAHLLLAEGWDLEGLERGAFPGGRFAAAPLAPEERRVLARLAGQALRHPEMPEPVALNIPGWLLPRFRARFGADLPAAAAALEQPAPLDLRVNLLRASRAEAAAALAAEGVETVPTPYSPWGLRVTGRRPVTGTRAFREGLVEIQDEGSQIVALLADARPGLRVCDYCAGAGGKTLAMAAAMGNKGRIVACDVSAPRLAGAVRRLRRGGVDNAERHLLVPGDRWAKRRAGQFDRVLVDAPCTGTGTWRRNPDARIRTRPEDLAELVRRQREILAAAAELVRPGGRLIYATCSVLPEEDEGQMQAFMAARGDFAPIAPRALWPRVAGEAAPFPGACGEDAPWLLLAPHRHGTDGFFVAVLERRPP
nr:RsmB/NOP family class I SAM-dependent RNA methyltransferase [Caldovatus aquaticus]